MRQDKQQWNGEAKFHQGIHFETLATWRHFMVDLLSHWSRWFSVSCDRSSTLITNRGSAPFDHRNQTDENDWKTVKTLSISGTRKLVILSKGHITRSLFQHPAKLCTHSPNKVDVFNTQNVEVEFHFLGVDQISVDFRRSAQTTRARYHSLLDRTFIEVLKALYRFV